MTLCHRPQRSHPLAVCPAPVANFLADRKDPSDGQAARRTPSHASIRKESQTRRVEDLEEPVSVEGLRPAPGHANRTSPNMCPALPADASGLATAGTERPCSSSHRNSPCKSFFLSLCLSALLGLLQLAVPPLLLFLPELLHAASCSASRRSAVPAMPAMSSTAPSGCCLVKSLLAPSPGRRVCLSIGVLVELLCKALHHPASCEASAWRVRVEPAPLLGLPFLLWPRPLRSAKEAVPDPATSSDPVSTDADSTCGSVCARPP